MATCTSPPVGLKKVASGTPASGHSRCVCPDRTPTSTSDPPSHATYRRSAAWLISMPWAPSEGSGQCWIAFSSSRFAANTMDGLRMARNTRSSVASTTHQRGRPGRTTDHLRSPSNPSTWSWGAWVSSPMQATTATCKDETIAAPFGRGPVFRTVRVSRVRASTQAMCWRRRGS